MPSESLTSGDRATLDKLLSFPLFYPEAFKTYLKAAWERERPLIPFTQFSGARLGIAKTGGFIATDESTTSTTYTDLATEGPEITGLADGKYLILFGADGRLIDNVVSVSINGATPSDSNRLFWNQAGGGSARGIVVTLENNNNNSIKVQYKKNSGGSAVFFRRRWLVALRISAG